MLAFSKYVASSTGKTITPHDEEAFARSFKMSDGTFRTTARGRLAPLDELVLKFRPERVDDVLDVGISFGITTLEWARSLHSRGLSPRVYATDKTLQIEVAHLPFATKIYTEKDSRHILHVEIAGTGFRSWTRRKDFVTGAVLFRPALMALARLALRLKVPRSEALLASPELNSDQERFVLTEADVLDERFAERFPPMDIVRIANLMQPIYFSDTQLRVCASNLIRCCRGPGSMIVVCRENDGELDGSILVMQPDRTFATVATIGRGSMVEHFFH